MYSLAAILLAYLLGSIPFGLLIMRAARQGDVRAIGSGNIGATNVLRAGYKGLAALTLLLDTAKGFAAIWIADQLEVAGHSSLMSIVGLSAVLGHIFPVWLKFKGGKGVATAIGVMLGIAPVVAASIMALWLFVFYLSRISSLASLLSFAINCIIAGIIGGWGDFLFMALITGLLCYTHRDNIRRLKQGTELGFRGEKS